MVVVVVGEVVEEEDSLLVAPLSSVCHQTSAHPCTLDQDSIPCCLRELWEVLEEEGPLTLVLACLRRNSTDRVGTHSIALRYLGVEAHEGPCLQWEGAWVLG